MASEVSGGRGHRNQSLNEFHSFPVHDNEAQFPNDVYFDDSSDYSDCSDDYGEPNESQLPVDYTGQELLHQHRRSHHIPIPRRAGGSGCGVAAGAASEGLQGAAAGSLQGGAAHLVGAGHDARSSRSRGNGLHLAAAVRLYSNPL